MSDWPETIPVELRLALTAFRGAAHPNAPENWWQAIRLWTDDNDIRLKLEWLPELARAVSEMERDDRGPDYQKLWLVLRQWLTEHEVPVPASIQPVQ